MRTLRVEELRPGMAFSDAVYIDATTIFVPSHVIIKEKDLQRLARMNIQQLLTDGQVVEGAIQNDEHDAGPVAHAPSLSTISKPSIEGFERMAFAGSSQQEMRMLYDGLMKEFGGIQTCIRDNEPFEPMRINQLIDTIFKILYDRRNDLIQYILFGLQGVSGIVENAINCAVLATIVGTNMNLQRHRLNILATGALLHDIGMLRVPREIVEKTDSLTSAELQQIRTHPVHSHRIITKELRLNEDVGIVALQHQERWDGQGYPKGLRGKDINIFARITAVVDAFEAMVSQRPYRDSMIGYAAMRSMISDNGRRFDPEILKVFIRSLGIYPIGSIVLLSDASIGRVTENHPDAPLRPRIRIMIDSMGKTYLKDEGEIIDLLEDRTIFVARAVNPKDLGQSV